MEAAIAVAAREKAMLAANTPTTAGTAKVKQKVWQVEDTSRCFVLNFRRRHLGTRTMRTASIPKTLRSRKTT